MEVSAINHSARSAKLRQVERATFPAKKGTSNEKGISTVEDKSVDNNRALCREKCQKRQQATSSVVLLYRQER